MVREENTSGPKGIFCVLVEDGVDGMQLGKKEKKVKFSHCIFQCSSKNSFR